MPDTGARKTTRQAQPTGDAIDQLMRRRATAGGLVRADRSGPLVASHQQEGLWIHSQVEPSPNAFRVPVVLRLSGPLDDRAFARSIEHVVERHEILRTSFRVDHGRLTQVVSPPGTVHLERIDLRGHTADDAEKQFIEFASATTLQLERGPLWRAALVRFDEREFRLWVFIHHIVWDGWSGGVFLRELQLGYEAFVQGREPVPSSLPLQYADFAASQKRRFELRHEEQVAYWTKRLEGARRTELPRDAVSPRSGRRRGGSHDFRLGSTCVDALRRVAKRSGASLFHVVLAGFAVALSRWTGNDDPIVAVAANNRSVAGTAQLIGFFVSMLPLRLGLSAGLTVEGLIARARAITLEALLNSDIPTTSVVAGFRSPDRRRNMPLGDIVMSFLPASGETTLGDVRASFIPAPAGWDRDPEADLALWAWEDEKDLGCLFVYDADILRSATIERMAEHLRELLLAMATHPEQRVAALPMLGKKERYQLVVEFSGGARDSSSFVPRKDLSIEQPLENSRAYVLDEELSPVPIGVVGRLHIGGEGLALAHLAQSDRTADSLLPDPFGTPHGGRLYRTGELVRWLPDGKLEFCGRPEAFEQPSPSGEPREYVAPRTPDEDVVANVWRTLLGVERVGVTDNFFELGGHSLLATQAVARLQDEFDVDLPVIAIFEAPTVEELAKRILELQLEQGGTQCLGQDSRMAAAEVIVRRDRSSFLPLSFAQERLWFLDQLEPRSSFYNIPIAMHVIGEVDEGALLRAFDALVARHESLRTTFEKLDGRVMQRIHEPQARVARVRDVSGWDEAAILTGVQQEADTPFDLQEGPLVRVLLLGRSTRERVLVVTTHHAVSDGWSVSIFMREMLALCDAFSRGERNPLPELAIQYADFAVWQREYLNKERLEREVVFWKALLERAPRALELPTDHPRPPVERHGGAQVSLELERPLVEGLRRLAQRRDATLFMVLLTSYGVLLGRHANQNDVVLGVPIANRVRAEVEPLIGFFANTMALRVRFEDDPTFGQLLARVKQMSLEAFEHQDFPFEKLVEALNPVRDLSRSPLFQVMFVLQNAPHSKLQMGGVILEPIEIEKSAARFDLTLSVTETEDGARASLEYKTDLFDRSTIERLGEHWRVLLEAMAAYPDHRVSAFPILGERERHQLVVEWNRGDRDYSEFVSREVLSLEQPLGNASAYVLDEEVNPVPIGVVGQLHIGGAGLARAHLAHSNLTADRFMPDPFGTPHGGRLYRTGKFARWLPGGSLDLRAPHEALEPPGPSAASNEYVAPRTPDEEVVANIWRKLLRVERVGVTDNFFALGGHSLLATQAVAHLQDAFDVDLPVIVMFEAPTVEALAERILELQLGDLSPESLNKILA